MKDSGLNVVLFFVGVTALFLWYRKTVATSTAAAIAPASAGVKTDAAGGVGLNVMDGICSLPAAKYIDFTGQCDKLKNDPKYRQDIANSTSFVFSKKGAKQIGGGFVENVWATSNPTNWFAGPQGSANWRNGKPLTKTAVKLNPSPLPPGGKPPATNAWKPAAAPSSNSKPTNAWGR